MAHNAGPRALHPRNQFGRKFLTLGRRNVEDIPLFLRQTAQARRDNPLHPGRNGAPVDGAGERPRLILIQNQYAAIAKVSQQLDRKQGMALGVGVEILAKAPPDAVGIRINQCIDEVASISLADLGQIQPDIAT
jgi:hypothetical protein